MQKCVCISENNIKHCNTCYLGESAEIVCSGQKKAYKTIGIRRNGTCVLVRLLKNKMQIEVEMEDV